MTYQIAEKFKSIQGEGVYAGTPMAFIRFVGCSVGKGVCVACDTDFEQPVSWRGGGEFSAVELYDWVGNYEHVCLTGGEPLDQDLAHLLRTGEGSRYHLETSGTKGLERLIPWRDRMWVCVSPKPGFIEHVVMAADEVKVIMPGLGVLKHGNCVSATRSIALSPENEKFAWPTLTDALRWANAGKTVFIQPRNGRTELDMTNLRLCQDIIAEHPQLRLSLQLHKLLKVQ